MSNPQSGGVSYEVVDNPEQQRYEVHMDGHTAVLTYERLGNGEAQQSIAFLHTGVPPALEGHGIANALAKTALDNARSQGLAVIPLCPFVAAYIRRHQDYLPLVAPDYRANVTQGE